MYLNLKDDLKDALGERETPSDRGLCVVSGEVGKALKLAGGGECLSYNVGPCVQLGGNGGFLGQRAHGPIGNRGHWRR